MRLVGVCCSILALFGCATPPTASLPPSLPLSVGNGTGSQYGNYGAKLEGEMQGPSGEHCVIYNWDRPLTADLAVRLRSSSCDSLERPGWMVCKELSRTVIPMAESNLKDEQDEARQ